MATMRGNRPVKFEELEFKTIIGRDETLDKIYKVVDRRTGKTYRLKEFSGAIERDKISGEIEILKRLDHPNVVKCYEVLYIGDLIFLLLEDMGRPLSRVNITSESDLTCLFHQVLHGLRYLHQNKIWHGDIMPSNIFVNHMDQGKVLYLGKSAVEVDQGNHDGFSWDKWNVRMLTLVLFKILNWCGRSVPDDGALIVPKRWTVEELLLLPPFFKHLLPEKRPLSAAKLTTAITHELEGSSSSRPNHREVQISRQDKISSKERCIQHCALFLPDFEFEKVKMVNMWIAEGCIEPQVSKRMEEDIANSYFDALVEENIIVPHVSRYQRMKYKVNKSAASTWFLGPSNYVRIDVVDNSDEVLFCDEEALHLTWHCETVDQTLFRALKNFKRLRTLVVLEDLSYRPVKRLRVGNFFALELLRTLDMSRINASELPDSIGFLVSLRCLDVSENPIKRLPESVDRLGLLQSLLLHGCFELSALPTGFGRLINLRHLDLNIIHQLGSMPKGMGNLTELRTLPGFVVEKNDGCGIGELKCMNEITGSFCITQLENVSSVEEAKEASLCDKKHIDELKLSWRHVTECSRDTVVEILGCLQPHFQLKKLQVSFYMGSKFPSWISNPSFTDLSSIILVKCINCDVLPSLGVLPSLKMLQIYCMDNLKSINTLFYRGDMKTKGFNAFPKLENLTICNMDDLEEWTGIEDGDFPRLCHISVKYCDKLCDLPSFTHLCSLRDLEISNCPQLTSLPEGLLPGTLESLVIRKCPKVAERCLKDVGVDWFKIASVKDVSIES